MNQAVIALDLGGTKLASCLFESGGHAIDRRAQPLCDRQGDEVGKLVAREVERLLRAAEKRQWNVRAIGVCVPGIANSRTGRVWAPNISAWDDYPLRAELKALLRDASIHVVVENDRAASILGEFWQGAARGCRNAIFLAVGTGIGAGILINGRILRGSHDIAGAVGWMALDRPFRPGYVQCGCFESHASGVGIAKVAAKLIAKKSYRGPLRTTNQLSARDIFAAFEQNDEVATQVLSEAIAFWGMATANLVSLLNPEVILFGGGVFGPATRFLEAIAAEAKLWAQPIAMQRVRFEASQLGGNAALYGAAYVAMRRAKLLNAKAELEKTPSSIRRGVGRARQKRRSIS